MKKKESVLSQSFKFCSLILEYLELWEDGTNFEECCCLTY